MLSMDYVGRLAYRSRLWSLCQCPYTVASGLLWVVISRVNRGCYVYVATSPRWDDEEWVSASLLLYLIWRTT